MVFTGVEKPHLLTSYKVAYCIAKAVKPLLLAKKVIKPCVVDMTDIILGDGAVRKLKQVMLPHDTISRRIKDLSIDVCYQLISDLKAFILKIVIQLDKSTDVSINLLCLLYQGKESRRRVFVLSTTAKNYNHEGWIQTSQRIFYQA